MINSHKQIPKNLPVHTHVLNLSTSISASLSCEEELSSWLTIYDTGDDGERGPAFRMEGLDMLLFSKFGLPAVVVDQWKFVETGVFSYEGALKGVAGEPRESEGGLRL
jgi:hypothetical protein